MKKFSYRIGNIEARLTDKSLVAYTSNNPFTVDVVHWSVDGDFCWSIAHFVETGEGWYLQFVNKRPLDAGVNWKDFRKVVKKAHKYLEKKHN